jgi:SAM-dependent methyltransferase
VRLKLPSILRPVEDYYTQKTWLHGTTSRGADWNTRESQELRFDQILKIWKAGAHPSLIDWGCGYGHLFSYMKKKAMRFRYSGFDLSAEMIRRAKEAHGDHGPGRFKVGSPRGERADYVVASGIFNVKLKASRRAWKEYLLRTLQGMNRCSRKGFSFNCLTKYSDKARMRPDLYYADPLFLFDYCKKHFSDNIGLLHDYGLYEFTLLIRK